MEQTNRGLERKRYESDKDYNKRIMQHNRILQVEIMESESRTEMQSIVNTFLFKLENGLLKKIKYSHYIVENKYRMFIVYITYYKNKE